MKHPSIVAAAVVTVGLVVAAWLVSSSLRALGQSVERAAVATNLPDDKTGLVSVLLPADEAIRGGDVLDVTIYDLVGPGVATMKTVRVGASGKVPMPYVGELHAAGQSSSQFEVAVHDALRNAQILQNAQVSAAARRPQN